MPLSDTICRRRSRQSQAAGSITQLTYELLLPQAVSESEVMNFEQRLLLAKLVIPISSNVALVVYLTPFAWELPVPIANVCHIESRALCVVIASPWEKQQ
jgi:hypothetical protein